MLSEPRCLGSPAWAAKDAGLALDAASDRELAVLAAIRDRWQHPIGQGLGDFDTSAAPHGLGRQPAATR